MTVGDTIAEDIINRKDGIKTMTIVIQYLNLERMGM